MSSEGNSNDPGYLKQSRQAQLLALNIAMAILATAAVSLRFYARKVSKAGLWWDDWAILFGLPITLVVNIFSAELVTTGQGKHEMVLPHGSRDYLHQLYYEILFYTPSLVFFKFSLLFLYVRVFPMRWVKLACLVLGILVAAWTILIEFILIFQCNPIRRAWNQDVPGKCLDQRSIFLGQSVPTITFDVSILVLAVPLVWMIRLPLSTKVALLGVFLMGGIVTLISIMRLYYTLQTVYQDFTWNYTTLALWSETEGAVGLLSACLPTFGGPIKKFFAKLHIPIFSVSRTKSSLNRSEHSEFQQPSTLTNRIAAGSDSTTDLANDGVNDTIKMRELQSDGICIRKDVLIAEEQAQRDFV